jgi:16S rRNA (cytosine1402-N4)-methyltransferase
MKDKLNELGVQQVDGILLDLGVSSYQLDTPERGFSYRFDARLDMRMDKSAALSAYEVVNNYSSEELIRILYNYGEENFAKLIVNKIIEKRSEKKIETTGELVNLIESAIPKNSGVEAVLPKRPFRLFELK